MRSNSSTQTSTGAALISPLYIVTGTLAGYVGIIPGLSPAAGITLLPPLTY